MAEDQIAAVEATEHVLPLPNPLRIGPMTVTERRYTSVRLRAQSGLEGVALAQSRGAPIAEIIDVLLTPTIIGRDAFSLHARWQEMFRATVAVGRVGLVLRAQSLIDIALWDLLGHRAELPLWRLLGGYRRTVPLTYVAGYPQAASDVESLVAVAAGAAAAGHRAIKVARTPDEILTREMLKRLDDELPPEVRVQVDANWIWSSVAEATSEIETWPVERLAWIEDPFCPEDERRLAALRRSCPVPVAAGDELADPAQALRLLAAEAVDVLRLDVVTIGGISAALPLISAAREHGVPVSLHISPELSTQLACGVPGCSDVETFDRAGNPFDPSHILTSGGATFRDGLARVGEAPGLGIVLAEPGQ